MGTGLVPDDQLGSKAETKSYGVYAQGNWRPAVFDDRLELTLGLRATPTTRRTRSGVQQRAVPTWCGGVQRIPCRPGRLHQVSVDRHPPDLPALRDRLPRRRRQRSFSQFTSFDEEENEACELGLKSSFSTGGCRRTSRVPHDGQGRAARHPGTPSTNPSFTDTFNVRSGQERDGRRGRTVLGGDGQPGPGSQLRVHGLEDWNDWTTRSPRPWSDITRFYTVSTPENRGRCTWTSIQPRASAAWASTPTTFDGRRLLDDTGCALRPYVGPTYERPRRSEALTAPAVGA